MDSEVATLNVNSSSNNFSEIKNSESNYLKPNGTNIDRSRTSSQQSVSTNKDELLFVFIPEENRPLSNDHKIIRSENNLNDVMIEDLDKNQEVSKSEGELLHLFNNDDNESNHWYNSISESFFTDTYTHSVPSIIYCKSHGTLPTAKESPHRLIKVKRYHYKNKSHHNRVLRRAISLPGGKSTAIPRKPQTNLVRRLSCSITKLTGNNFTFSQKTTLLCIAFVSFTSFLSMSIIAPFFPHEAFKKGMRESVSGFVFSSYALVIMLTSPIIGKLLPHIGAKFLIISGIGVAGVSNILFGVLDKVNGQSMFTLLCFVVRIFEALGSAAFSTASYTYIMEVFPDDIGTAFGLTETSVGLGMSLGPAIGGVLYGIGGYGLPFYALGALMLLNIPLCLLFLDPINDSCDIQKPAKSSYLKLLSQSEILVVCLVVVIVSQSVGFLDPTIEPHFRQFGVSAQFIGVVFLLLSAAYAITSPLIGWISSKIDNTFPLMALGMLVITIGLLFLGPSNLIPLNPSIMLSTLSMVIMGVAYAIAFIPTFECILDIAIDNGFVDDTPTYSLVSGLWSSMYALGEVTGPSLGGIFLEVFDFSISVTLMAGFSIITSILVFISYYCNRNRYISQAESDFSDSTDFESASTKETSSTSETIHEGRLSFKSIRL